MSRLTFLALLLFFTGSLKAQIPTRQYYFTHYTATSGLASSEVNTVAQDADGFIWVGTNDGLQRFDGTRFKTFRADKRSKYSIPFNSIWQLLMDNQKNLWVLTADGHVGIFDTKNFRFLESAVQTKEPGAMQIGMKKLIKDEFGNLFLLLTSRELVTYDAKSNTFSYKYNFFKNPEGTRVSGFAQETGSHRYWVGFEGKGIAIYDHNTRQLNFLTDDGNDMALANLQQIHSPYNFYFDSRQRLWFQVWGGGFPYVYCYDRSSKTPLLQFEFITTLKTYYEAQDFFEQKDGTVWLSGLGLMARFNEKLKNFELTYNGYRNERSIVYERVNGFAEDRENSIWVATSNNGLYRFNPEMQFFTNVAHVNRLTGNPGKGSIMSFAPTKWGTLLAGSWGDGLYNYDREMKLVPANIKGIDNNYGPTVWAMCPSRDSNTIWLAAQPGIWAIDQNRRSANYYNPPQLMGKTVRQLVEDAQGNLWMGAQGFGIFKWNAQQGKKKFEDGVHRFEKIPVVQINKIMVDHKGWIWVATGTRGVYVVDPVTEQVMHHFDVSESGAFHLPEPGVSSVLDYDDSTVVITISTQIFLFNRYTRQTTQLGNGDSISGLIAASEKDSNGYIWLSTTTGIYRVNVRRKVFVRFNRDDGIDNDHFILSSSRSLPDGRLAFGSSDQFVVFDPKAIQISETAPAVAITDIKVGNKGLKVDSLLKLPQVELQSGNNSLVIEFSTLTFNSPFPVKYKLEGLDPDWRIADQTNQAIYSYLPTGKYVFVMKTLNEQGESNGPETRLSIRVNPPFYRTWWFFSLLAILAGTIIFGIDRERLKRKEAIQKMRTEIADNLHTQVNTALNNINILSEMARLKAEKDPAKSKEYIEQIHTKSHNMIIAMDDMLWSINPENDNMSKTTDRMREYIDALQNRYSVNIDLQVDKKVESLELNMRLRHEAFLVFKEAIKNLITVGAQNLHVYISFEKGNLLFTTQFDTETCDIQQLNNLLHRQDLENRLNLMGASIDIDVHKTNSLITLEVPVY